MSKRSWAGAVPDPASAFDITMSQPSHHDVRTTLTIDDDVAAKLKAEARRRLERLCR